MLGARTCCLPGALRNRPKSCNSTYVLDQLTDHASRLTNWRVFEDLLHSPKPRQWCFRNGRGLTTSSSAGSKRVSSATSASTAACHQKNGRHWSSGFVTTPPVACFFPPMPAARDSICSILRPCEHRSAVEPDVLEQRIARIHRMRQKRPVRYNSATKPKKESNSRAPMRPPIYPRWTGSAACAASSVASRPSGLKTWAANRFSPSSGSAIPFRNPAIAWRFEAGGQAAISVHAPTMPPANWAPDINPSKAFGSIRCHLNGLHRRCLSPCV